MLFALLSLIIVILCVLCYRLIFQVFNGNSGRNDIVKHSLKEYASARFIRFQPTTFNIHKALRVEVYGILVSTGTVLHVIKFGDQTHQGQIHNFSKRRGEVAWI